MGVIKKKACNAEPNIYVACRYKPVVTNFATPYAGSFNLRKT